MAHVAVHVHVQAVVGKRADESHRLVELGQGRCVMIPHQRALIGHALSGERRALAPSLLPHVQDRLDAEALQEGGVTSDPIVVRGAGAPELPAHVHVVGDA